VELQVEVEQRASSAGVRTSAVAVGHDKAPFARRRAARAVIAPQHQGLRGYSAGIVTKKSTRRTLRSLF